MHCDAEFFEILTRKLSAILFFSFFKPKRERVKFNKRFIMPTIQIKIHLMTPLWGLQVQLYLGYPLEEPGLMNRLFVEGFVEGCPSP